MGRRRTVPIIIVRRRTVVVIVIQSNMHASEAIGHGGMMMGHNVVGQRCDLAVVQQLICRRHAIHCCSFSSHTPKYIDMFNFQKSDI